MYDGNISTTAVDWASALPIAGDYLLVRTGQYDYTFYTGKLTRNGNNVNVQGKIYTLDTRTSYNDRNYFTSNVHEGVVSVTLNGSQLVYSNIVDGMPRLDRGVLINETSLFIDIVQFALLTICLVLFVKNRVFGRRI